MKKILIIIFVLVITFGISSSYVQSNILNMFIKSGIENNQIFPEEDGLSVLVCGSGSPLGTAVAQTCLLVKAGDKKFRGSITLVANPGGLPNMPPPPPDIDLQQDTKLVRPD